MENKILKFEPRSDNIVEDRKEKHFYQEYALIDLDKKRAVAILRVYATNKMSYACLWLHFCADTRGSGKAGGYGYHRPSAACARAFQSTGIELQHSIAGVGDSAIMGAMEALRDMPNLYGLPSINGFVHVSHA